MIRSSNPILPSFFFTATATTEIYTLSLHDALPIYSSASPGSGRHSVSHTRPGSTSSTSDRKSTRLNSSHTVISYAVFCLKKKTTKVTYGNTVDIVTLKRNIKFIMTLQVH